MTKSRCLLKALCCQRWVLRWIRQCCRHRLQSSNDEWSFTSASARSGTPKCHAVSQEMLRAVIISDSGASDNDGSILSIATACGHKNAQSTTARQSPNEFHATIAGYDNTFRQNKHPRCPQIITAPDTDWPLRRTHLTYFCPVIN